MESAGWAEFEADMKFRVGLTKNSRTFFPWRHPFCLGIYWRVAKTQGKLWAFWKLIASPEKMPGSWKFDLKLWQECQLYTILDIMKSRPKITSAQLGFMKLGSGIRLICWVMFITISIVGMVGIHIRLSTSDTDECQLRIFHCQLGLPKGRSIALPWHFRMTLQYAHFHEGWHWGKETQVGKRQSSTSAPRKDFTKNTVGICGGYSGKNRSREGQPMNYRIFLCL